VSGYKQKNQFLDRIWTEWLNLCPDLKVICCSEMVSGHFVQIIVQIKPIDLQFDIFSIGINSSAIKKPPEAGQLNY